MAKAFKIGMTESNVASQSYTIETSEPEDSIPPVVTNVYHHPLYPTSSDNIFFDAKVTDNVAVARATSYHTKCFKKSQINPQ
jgi:hypothetical protein